MWLLFAHFVADWGLQTPFMSDNKSKHWLIMFAHCTVYTGIIAITLQYLEIITLWKIIFIFIGHFIGDTTKGKFAKSEKDWWMIYPDHIWHLLQLIVVYCI